MIVGSDVLAVLSTAQIAGKALTLTGRLDRRLYDKTNEVLKAAGGKWNRKAKAHVFDKDPADVIDQVILSGEITVPKDFGFFPTPPEIVAMLILRADLRAGLRVLEPSAGQGAIAVEVARICDVDCIEFLAGNVAKLRELQDTVPGIDAVLEGDFLESVPTPIYDRVVMNPPFEKQSDIRHVLHALAFLKPGGRLVAVMAAGVTFRQDRLATSFRQLVTDHGGTIEDLPEGAFKASGTMVRTVVVTMVKS